MGYNNRSTSPAPLAHLAQQLKSKSEQDINPMFFNPYPVSIRPDETYESYYERIRFLEEQISKQIAENDRLQQEFLETRRLQKLKRLPTPKSKYHH